MMIKNTNIDYDIKINDIKLELYQNSKNDKSSLLIIINKPESLNAISSSILKELLNILDYYKDREFVRSIVITGSGKKAFIAGADIKSMSNYSPQEAYEYSCIGQKLVENITSYNKPIVAAVNGYALGGGCEIASACHIRYASENASFGQPEVKLGLLAGFGGTQRLPKVVSKGKAMEMLLTGNMYTAEEAHSFGLVDDIFESKDLMSKVKDICNLIVKNGPNSISKTIELVNKSYDLDQIDGFSIEAIEFGKLFDEKESKEGMGAFIEKRKPNFD